MKISSEAAEYIAITPVVAKEMPVRELIETLLGTAGKNAARIRELLLRGSVVAGASRLRWQGWDAPLDAIEAVLATFPDPEPSRAFAREDCVRAVLIGSAARIEIERGPGSERRLFRRRSFWDCLMELAEAGSLQYVTYSYRDRADHYKLELASADAELLREYAGTIRYSSLEARIRRARFDMIEFHVERPRGG